jgi:TolB protein
MKRSATCVPVLLLAACSSEHDGNAAEDVPPLPVRAPAWVVRPDTPGETHLRNVRQLTFGGDNAEAYWSWKGDRLVFQMSRRNGVVCDQIFVMDADGNGERLVSTGKGRTTCAYFLPGDRDVVFASTHHTGDACPPLPEAVPGGYTWPLFDYDVWRVPVAGGEPVRVAGGPGYDAEPTVAPDGTIVFTSERDGDLDIYTMRADGSDVRRLTTTLGYDGGPVFSPDGSKIVYRTHHPATEQEVGDYKRLLAARWVQPTRMAIWVMDRDGSNQRQVTHLAGSSFAPCFTPDGERILFSSNWESPRGWAFDLWLVKLDGTGLQKVTTAPEFDAFPMFSPDGKRLVWESNRFNDEAHKRDTNVFIADWVE